MPNITSWICPDCRDYNAGEAYSCAYCGQSAEFPLWLAAVDTELADRDSSRAKLPYKRHQWWELWDHGIPAGHAVSAALLLQPGEITDWPEHAAYSTN